MAITKLQESRDKKKELIAETINLGVAILKTSPINLDDVKLIEIENLLTAYKSLAWEVTKPKTISTDI